MRRDVKKFIFFGALEDRERFFRQAQQAGIVQFIDPSKRGPQERPHQIQKLIDANRILRTVKPMKQEDFIEASHADEVAERICWLAGRITDLQDEKRIVTQEISRIHIFGHFSIEDLHYLEAHGRVVQFFFSRHAHDVGEEPHLIDVGSDHALHYFVSISPHRMTYPGLTEMRIERSLGSLEGRFKEIEHEISRAEHELKGYAKRKEALETALIAHLNEYHLLTAQEHVEMSLGNSVFAVEGWVAEHKIAALDRMARKTSVHHEEILIEPQDQVPTCLENHGYARVGEDVLHVYDSPS
ncbi:MAG: V-type ATP synthase subunit I, partial [Verrucomicrobia bacterium]|nr:V-type ATP synthase subunit I [Verrucomicrobiota bacterium]